MLKIGKDKALFIAKKLRNEFIYNMAKLEGNTLSYPEAETVIYGTSIAGKKMSELHQIEHIRDAWDEIIQEVKDNNYICNKYNFCMINYIVSENENRDSRGNFRTEPVAISGTSYSPPMPIELNALFEDMIKKAANTAPDIKALDIFMESSRNQYFGDGNKRTALLMMNGILISSGYAPISIDPKDEVEYRRLLISYYETGNKEDFRSFLLNQQKKITDRFHIEDVSIIDTTILGNTLPFQREIKHETTVKNNEPKEFLLDGLRVAFERYEENETCGICGDWKIEKQNSSLDTLWIVYYQDIPVVDCVANKDSVNNTVYDIRPIISITDKTYSGICDIAHSHFPECRMIPEEMNRIANLVSDR